MAVVAVVVFAFAASELSNHAQRALLTAYLALSCVAISVGLAIYFLPSFVAIRRGHNNSLAIFALNLLLGWVFIGWVVAMVWACIEIRPQRRR